eukprot:Lithocolla_globosa_v1_NODE_2728_length_1888_cov_163.877317.p1 type:complete len:141 gc:universal NODE_2728_length_1888_cov_163.877317:533-111(-)
MEDYEDRFMYSIQAQNVYIDAIKTGLSSSDSSASDSSELPSNYSGNLYCNKYSETNLFVGGNRRSIGFYCQQHPLYCFEWTFQQFWEELKKNNRISTEIEFLWKKVLKRDRSFLVSLQPQQFENFIYLRQALENKLFQSI